MSEFKFSCAFCGQHLQCDEPLSGRQIQCPSCNHLIRVPPSPTQAAQGKYAPESGRTWATFIAPPKAERTKGLKIGDNEKPLPPAE